MFHKTITILSRENQSLEMKTMDPEKLAKKRELGQLR